MRTAPQSQSLGLGGGDSMGGQPWGWPECHSQDEYEEASKTARAYHEAGEALRNRSGSRLDEGAAE